MFLLRHADLCVSCETFILNNFYYFYSTGDNAVEVVKELERQKSLGRIKAYGVSNFGKENLENFLAAGGKPVTNQVMFSAQTSETH